jgi:hypothetical protein
MCSFGQGVAADGDEFMRAFIWLSFDLGIRGDLEGIYQFLGEHEAKECGSNMAAFAFTYNGDIATELTENLKNVVTFDKRSRVYLIYPRGGKYVGKFIIGSRRAPPWSSFIPSQDNEEDIGE